MIHSYFRIKLIQRSFNLKNLRRNNTESRGLSWPYGCHTRASSGKFFFQLTRITPLIRINYVTSYRISAFVVYSGCFLLRLLQFLKYAKLNSSQKIRAMIFHFVRYNFCRERNHVQRINSVICQKQPLEGPLNDQGTQKYDMFSFMKISISRKHFLTGYIVN